MTMLEGEDGRHFFVRWPIEATYYDWVDQQLGDYWAWPLYKLRSAGSFVVILDQAIGVVGFTRNSGVEMALDAALASLVGAFDAAVASVISAGEARLEVRRTDHGAEWRPTPPHKYNWSKARALLRNPEVLGRRAGIRTTCERLRIEVDQALATEPRIGWLEALRRLRNRTVHQDTLPRHTDVRIGGADAGTTVTLTVEGVGQDPVQYLNTSRTQVGALLTKMLSVADLLAPNGIATHPEGWPTT